MRRYMHCQLSRVMLSSGSLRSSKPTCRYGAALSNASDGDNWERCCLFNVPRPTYMAYRSRTRREVSHCHYGSNKMYTFWVASALFFIPRLLLFLLDPRLCLLKKEKRQPKAILHTT